MKIALIHDYLSQDGGAEQVLRAFHEIWPEAPIFVLFADKKKVSGFEKAEIRQSFLSRVPFVKKRYRWLLPLMPMATERYNLHEFDIVLSSTSAFAKGVLTQPHTLHISYCHTPTRYLWTDTHQYIDSLKLNPITELILPRVIHKLRIWDRLSAERVDHFIANSNTVQKRIKKYYKRKADVIYPPVDVSVSKNSVTKKDFYISGGRFVPYKRFDLIVETFNRLGSPIKLFGVGPELEKLKKKAKPNIEFLGRISDAERDALLAQAKAFIHPQVEDFGITPVEAMAAGTPVIAYGVGGVTETVLHKKTGYLFAEQSWEGLYEAVLASEDINWNTQSIQDHAQRFSKEVFGQKIQKYVQAAYAEFQQQYQQCALPHHS